MSSQLIQGHTAHQRFAPRTHAFDYAMTWLCLDVDELSQFNRPFKLLTHNRRGLLSVWDRDYAKAGAGSIRSKIESLLREHNISAPIERITVITLPRLFGYAFNPVSFFRCYSKGGTLRALIAEVRNTVGDKHHYVLEPANAPVTAGAPILFRCPKTFYVSPFLQVRGEYEVELAESDDSFSLEVRLRQDRQLIFTADLSGCVVPLTTCRLAMSAVRISWSVATVMGRISWQAIQLWAFKRFSVYSRAASLDRSTFAVAPTSMWHQLRKRLIDRAARRLSSSVSHPSGISGKELPR